MIKLAKVAVNEGGTLKAPYTIEFKQGGVNHGITSLLSYFLSTHNGMHLK